MLSIINGDSRVFLRIVDWFATNYAKKNYTVYDITEEDTIRRFKVYNDYKLKLKAYSKKRLILFVGGTESIFRTKMAMQFRQH